MENEIDEFINYLRSIGKYNKLLTLFETQKNRGYIFELYFAYAMEMGGIKLNYEINANPDTNKTVDFQYEFNGAKLWFELVSADINETMKNDIEQQHTVSLNNGISYHQVLIQSNSKNPYYDHAGQLIRLQEKMLEKPGKFSDPDDTNFNVIVVDCSQVYFGGFDADDFRNLVYGYSKDPYFQASIKGQRMVGLLEESFIRKNAKEFKSRISAIICIGKLQAKLFESKQAFISCNPLLGTKHYNKTFNALLDVPPLNPVCYINPIKLQNGV